MVSAMRTLAVESFPLRESYGSFEGAIAGALNDPLQPKAKADTVKVLGSCVEDAWGTDTDCAIQFSNGIWLHIRVEDEAVSWSLLETSPSLAVPEPERVGSPAVTLRWPNVGDHIMNRSELAAKRIGSEFTRLFVTSGALLVYCRGQLIWWFSAVRQTETGRPFLFVTEDD